MVWKTWNFGRTSKKFHSEKILQRSGEKNNYSGKVTENRKARREEQRTDKILTIFAFQEQQNFLRSDQYKKGCNVVAFLYIPTLHE